MVFPLFRYNLSIALSHLILGLPILPSVLISFLLAYDTHNQTFQLSLDVLRQQSVNPSTNELIDPPVTIAASLRDKLLAKSAFHKGV